MKPIYLFFLGLLFTSLCHSQEKDRQIVFTSDIDHFWEAFDSLTTTTDSATQVSILQKLYIDRGTPGLAAFMKARNYDAPLWVQLIHKYPKFWNSIRPNTFEVKNRVAEITTSIDKFKILYPAMRPAKMYFTVGGLRSGGTTTKDMVLIGTEIANADKYTDASELSNWLKTVFKNQDNSNIVALNVHEYVHTQQKESDEVVLLSQTIMEGAADFIAELVTGRENNNAYMVYGRAHEAELKEKFKAEMFATATRNWLYNGAGAAQADLGYFIGYTICKSYYQQQPDKTKAIRDIIQLDYAKEKEVTDFLARSRFYTTPFDKEEIMTAYKQKQPSVSGFLPAINGQNDVSPTLTELTILFSQVMGDNGYSINFGESGKEHFPLAGVKGFSDDHLSFTVKLALQPAKEYEFVITGRSFVSAAGYPLNDFIVRFKTK